MSPTCVSTVHPQSAPRARGGVDAGARAQARELLVELWGLPATDGRRAGIRTRLVRLNTPLVHYTVKRFKNSKEPLEDLTQVGMIGLIKSIDRFDPTRGLEFSTYAVPTISGEIKRYFRDAAWAMHVPRGARDLHSTITTARTEMSQRLGTSPTAGEIATMLGVTETEVVTALDAGRAYTTSSLEGIEADTGEGRAASIGYNDTDLDRAELYACLRPALAKLPDRDRQVLALRFVHDQSQVQIAHELGVSQMQISRILRSCLDRLHDTLETTTGPELRPTVRHAS